MRLSCVVLFIIIFLQLIGCRTPYGSHHNVSVGTSSYLEYPVGIWQSKEHNWAFKIEEDGEISKLIHPLGGPMTIEEGSKELEGSEEGTFAVFALGPVENYYDSAERKLCVEVILDLFHMKLPNGVLEGNSRDSFIGNISENGKAWKANWLNYTWLKGAAPPNSKMIETNPIQLIFTKRDN
ncbi:MAG: hypothetical protein K8R02_09310 [Anaerohalosphaeraceae bacterium]|nr:hypothetical protein [Anaerohalosphaeraceae bacterium]